MTSSRSHSAPPVRRIKFTYGQGDLGRHYVEGDLVMSHIVSGLSAVFPAGEDFFVRSVRHFRDDVTDPVLAAQVAGFIGQEVTHGREHRALNERLGDMGYPTRFIDKRTKVGLAIADRLYSPKMRLAMTSALEHYTATVAECLLTKPEAQALLGENEVRSMLLWHALEESEHKAVAFDVFRAVGGTERMRIWMMRWVTFSFLFFVIVNTLISLARDRAAYHPVRLVRSFAKLRHSPFLAADVRQALSEYNRLGYHPDDHDNSALLERWSAELFGAQGSLTDHLR